MGKKKRILYIESNRDGTIGGSYYSLFYLVEGLDKEKYDPVVMFYEENPLIDQFKEVVKEVIVFDHYSPASGCVRSLRAFVKFIPRVVRDIVWGHIKLLKIIDQIKPDIVHLNNSYASNHDWVLACKRRGVKIVSHDRGTRPGVSLQTRFFVKFLDAIICVSDAYLQYVTGQGLKPKKACRVYNGLDVNTLDGLYTSKQREIVRREFKVGENGILVGMVGNIDYWKGQLVLVNAIAIVTKKYQNIKVVLVGKTVSGAEQYEENIKACIIDHNLEDTIFLAGYRADVPALLNAFDIFVHASVEPEPFGRVILEAMAMKKPIVATELGGPAEIIVDGESGLLVPMDDESAMAGAILKYLANMKKAGEIGFNGWLRLKENFSIQKMVQGVESVYEELFFV